MKGIFLRQMIICCCVIIATSFIYCDQESAQVVESDNFVDVASKGSKEEAWNRLIDYYNGQGTWNSLSSSVRKGFIGITPTIIDGWLALLSNPTTLEDCRKLEIPATVLCGECTMEVERRLSEIIAKLIPDCRYKIIKGAGHLSPITHPKEVAKELKNHFQCYPKPHKTADTVNHRNRQT